LNGDQTVSGIAPGQCSLPIKVFSTGSVRVTEAAVAGTHVADIDVTTFNGQPAYFEPNTENYGLRTATVPVTPGDPSHETMVTFSNDIDRGQLKVCKTLARGADALVGSTFKFVVHDLTIDSYARVSIKAGKVGQTVCVLVDGPGPLSEFAAGDRVTVTEEGEPGDNVPNATATSIVCTPNAAQFVVLGGLGHDSFADTIIAAGTNVCTFTNTGFGLLKICKNADPSTFDNQGWFFSFTINGDIKHQVLVEAGTCTLVTVPAGLNTVVENPTPTEADGDPKKGSDQWFFESLTVLPGGHLVSQDGKGGVVINVPAGGGGNLTEINFVNAVNTGSFEICKTTTDRDGGDGNFLTSTFTFSYAVQNDDGSFPTPTATAPLRIDGCTKGIAGGTVIRPNGSKRNVIVTETATTYTGGLLGLNISYSWSGNPPGQLDNSGDPARFDLGVGTQILTADNEPTDVIIP
jgi:hypothetical protein